MSRLPISRIRGKNILAITLSLALASLSPATAIACEGTGFIEGENEGQEFLGGHTYEVNLVKGEKKIVTLKVHAEKATFGTPWTKGGDTTNWNYLELTSCPTFTFSPGETCNIGVELLNLGAGETSLTIPVEFKPSGDKTTYEVKFKTK
jgi:hypothetical protein